MDTKETTPSDSIPPKGVWRRLGRFAKELWDDHDFWIRTFAFKGGAGAMIFGATSGISYAVSLPFILMTGGIAICGGLIAVGVSCILLSSASACQRLVDVYRKTIAYTPGLPPFAKKIIKSLAESPVVQKVRQSEACKKLYAMVEGIVGTGINLYHKMLFDKPQMPSFIRKLQNDPRVKRFLERPLIQKILKSNTWKVARRLTHEPQELFLANMAMGGSLYWGVISAVALVTNVVLLPVIAVGSVLTTGTVVAAGVLLSSLFGIYLSTQKLIHHFKPEKTVELEKNEPVLPADELAFSRQPEEAGSKLVSAYELTPGFTQEVEKPLPASKEEPKSPSLPKISRPPFSG